MSRVIRRERERGRMTLAETELGEARDLMEDLVRGLVVDAILPRTIDEWGPQPLHVSRASRSAHRAPQHVGGRWREGGDGHRDAQDLLLEEDHPEGLLEDRFE